MARGNWREGEFLTGSWQPRGGAEHLKVGVAGDAAGFAHGFAFGFQGWGGGAAREKRALTACGDLPGAFSRLYG